MRLSRIATGKAALLLLAAAFGGCGDSDDAQRPADPRVTSLLDAPPTVPAETLKRAAEGRFDDFRALCKRQRAAADALSAYRRSIGGHVRTEEQGNEVARLMAAIAPLDAEIHAWFERAEFDDADRNALRHIHETCDAP